MTAEYTEDMRTYTTIFTYSKPSDVLDKLLIEIQLTEEINFDNWVIEFPKENPKVMI